MLSPKRVKHRKTQKGKRRGKAFRGSDFAFGTFGLRAMEVGWVSNREIEAARIAISRHVKRQGKMWINIFPDKPLTVKPLETRMGSGKGNPEHWVAVVRPGRIMFELEGVPYDLAKEAMERAMHKLSIKTKFAVREDAVFATTPGAAASATSE